MKVVLTGDNGLTLVDSNISPDSLAWSERKAAMKRTQKERVAFANCVEQMTVDLFPVPVPQ